MSGELSSKQWWKLSKGLLLSSRPSSSVPPLKKSDGSWVLDPLGKSNVLADAFMSKSSLVPQQESLDTSHLQILENSVQWNFVVRSRVVKRQLDKLKEDVATGPDLLPARILKRLSRHLCVPIALLLRLIMSTGQWPEQWRLHWIIPLFKRGSPSIPRNYRGVHLTSIVSKIAERILTEPVFQFIERQGILGESQFAYRKRHSFMDVLAVLTVTWLQAICHHKKVGIYCSDIAGAFDRVMTAILLYKLRCYGVTGNCLKFFCSLLERRQAYVVVGGEFSSMIPLMNTIFQGTVCGPQLWNVFFADVCDGVRSADLIEYLYADDLNCFKMFDDAVSNDMILHDLRIGQSACHSWGRQNRVEFESSKESFSILSRKEPCGPHFKLLGIEYDTSLYMQSVISGIASRAGAKVRMIFRVRRYYDLYQILRMYKSQVWSVIEWATPAIFHVAASTLDQIDRVQQRFLRFVDVTEEAALLHFNCAPLPFRRCVAILGLIFRCVHGLAPRRLCRLFQLRETRPAYPTRAALRQHDLQLIDPIATSSSTAFRRSIFCMIRVWNALPAYYVHLPDVKAFQSALQHWAKVEVHRGTSINDICKLRFIHSPYA